MLAGALESTAGKLQALGALILILGIVAGVVFVIAPAYMSVAATDAPEADGRSLPLQYLAVSVVVSSVGAALYIAAAIAATRKPRDRAKPQVGSSE